MCKKIALIFDFDDTLAPESTSGYLERAGIDIEKFWDEILKEMIQGENWDPSPAYIYKMLQVSNAPDFPGITKDSLIQWGQQLTFYKGVETIFERLRQHIAEISSEITLEFYLISGGIGEILRNTSIAHNFKQIWACEFIYDTDGKMVFPKNIVSFTDKTRYLFQISKGIIGPDYYGKPFEVNCKTQAQHIRIPLNNMIFVADGFTDIPCFALVKKKGGITIGVYDAGDVDKWDKACGHLEDGLVHHLAPTDYSEGSELSNSLMKALENIALRC